MKLHELLQRAHALLSKAEVEKRNLTETEKLEFDILEEQIRFQKASDNEKRILAANGGSYSGTGEQWRDASTGREIRVFGKGESLATHYRVVGAKDPDFGIGDICRALALGPKTDVEKRALSEGTQSAGGYGVPVITSAALIDAMRAKSSVLNAGAKVVPLESNKVVMATIATDPTAAWRAENAAVSESDPVFGNVQFTAQTLAFYFKTSVELLQDSVNLNEAVQAVIAGAMAGELDRVCLLGSGAGTEPKGLKNIAGVGSVSMGTNGAALTNYDPFVDAISTMLTANASLPTAFIMAPRTYAAAAKLKLTTNDPMRKPALIENIPFIPCSRLPINETQGSSSLASRVILGNFAEAMIGIRQDVVVRTLTERFADTGQVAFLAWFRGDFQVRHAASFSQIVGVL
jgi:HK97 family phage major capsid protein